MKDLNHLRKSLCLCVILLGAFCFSATSYAMSDAEREAKLSELRSTIEQLKTELDKVKNNRTDLQNNLEKSESAIGELSKKVQQLKTQLDNEQSHLQQLHSEKEALFSVKKQQQGSVEQHVNAAYRLGQQSQLKMLLNQQDASAVSRNIKYYNYLMKAQSEKIKGFTATIHRLESIEPEIRNTVAQLKTNHEQLDRKRQQLLQQYSDRKSTLAKLESTIASKDGELKALDSDRRNLEALLQRVVRVTGDMGVNVSRKPFASLKGLLPWPTKGKILRTYGSSRVSNKVRWQGMLIGAEEGNPVYAIHHGRVVFSDYLRGHGLLLILDHGDGFMSLYAHNQALYKELGDWVNAGEQIAAVGLSGGQSQAGLYFEMRYKGEPTNPQKWLKKSA